MADTITALPTPPAQSSNKNETRVQRAKNRISKAAGSEPSELFGKHAPKSWGQSLLEQLATTIELAKRGKAGIRVEQLVARLKEEADRDPTAKGVVSNGIVTRIRLEITGKSRGCAPQDEEDEVAESDGDAQLTSSPSKGRPLKRRRKNPEPEPEPQAVNTEDKQDKEDGEDAEDSRDIASPGPEAKGPLPIEDYHKRIAAHQHRLKLFEDDRDAAQLRLDQKDPLNNALQETTAIRDSTRTKAQESATALAELEALVARHGDILPATVRDSIDWAKDNSDDANREAEQAEVDLAAAQKRVDELAAAEPALRDTVVIMTEGIAGCLDDIDKEEKDMDAALCMQSIQRLTWKVLRAKPVEQVNDLRSLIDDMLASGEGGE
ncbi:uncharacterized protein FTJAE_13775 [Fusarium tjaetaba]|uniref:Uncharacterized protein n=1 Tax=Fusarium tjaetaba TaxID=1567544 RepID=A0A8H5QGB6_9HYPO|nr:uncharacterized protein FTJAE_13775 [Fusarium tjaetaba]KAF5614098.1 hypothetical protein FTJAE_13775 [Fusarium tjaetaba]